MLTAQWRRVIRGVTHAIASECEYELRPALHAVRTLSALYGRCSRYHSDGVAQFLLLRGVLGREHRADLQVLESGERNPRAGRLTDEAAVRAALCLDHLYAIGPGDIEVGDPGWRADTLDALISERPFVLGDE